MGKSVSFVGGDGNLKHNNREFFTPNVDRSLTSQNIILVNQPLEEAYEHLFGEALKEYNAKQKRQDRIIGNYLEHVRNSGNGQKPFYEYIAQVGNRDDTRIGSTDAQEATKILKEFYDGFIKRNPNLYVFNAVIHLDEMNGTPHLHLNFIPFATGYKKGLETQTSMRKAMDQMGFKHLTKAVDDPHIQVTVSNLPKWANVQWWSVERTNLGNLLEAHGIEWEQMDIHRKNIGVSEYRAMQEAISKRVEQCPVAKVETREAPAMLTATKVIKPDEVIAKREDIEAMLQENTRLRTQAEISRETIARMDRHKREQDLAVQTALTNARSQTLQADAIRREFSSGTQEQYLTVLSENRTLQKQVVSLQTECKIAQQSEQKATTALQQLQTEVVELRADIPLQIENAVKMATEPLKAQIAKQQSLIENLQARLNNALYTFRDCMRAVMFLFKENIITPKGVERNRFFTQPTTGTAKVLKAIHAVATPVLNRSDVPQELCDFKTPIMSNEIAKKIILQEKERDR